MNDFQLKWLRESLIKGEEKAYRMLMKETGDYCIRKLQHSRNCSIEDAEDIYMDAILIFRENMLSDKIKSISSLRAYLWAICKNKWSELNRKQRRQQLAYSAKNEDRQALEMMEQDPLVAEEEKNQDQLLWKKRKRISHKALMELGERCRSILTYFYAEDKSMAEIAAIMGYANAQTVKNLKSRCYKQWISIAHEKMDLNHE